MIDKTGRVVTDESGKRRYTPGVEFPDRDLRERISAAVIALVRQRDPEGSYERRDHDNSLLQGGWPPDQAHQPRCERLDHLRRKGGCPDEIIEALSEDEAGAA